jgi:hypothetical protein
MPRLRTLAASLLVLAACESATAPAHLTIDVVAVTGEPFIFSAEESTRIQCPFEFTANASGSEAASGAWDSAVFRWYFGPEGTEPADSLVVSTADMLAKWGTEPLTAGRQQQSHWTFWGTAPFRMIAEFRYRVHPDGRDASTQARLRCGPSVDAGGPAPVVAQVQITPDSGEMEPGQSLEVTYSANSTVGLWQTVVVTSGAFELRRVTPEEYRNSTTRTVRFTVPDDARTGEVVAVSVHAQDIGSQWGRADTVQAATIVDRTAPTLLSAATDFFAHTPALAGSYAPGDTLGIRISARDNHQLSSIIVELGSPADARDSVVVSGSAIYDRFVRIPVQQEWLGSPIVNLYVRDAAGLKSNELSSLPDSIVFYPIVDGPVRSATVTGSSRAVVHDPIRDLLFLSEPDSARLNILSLGTMTLHPPTPLPSGASSGDLTPGGDSLVLALPNARAFAVVDLTRSEAAPSLIPFTADSTGEMGPYDLQVMADGKVLAVVATIGHSREEVIELELRTGEQRQRDDAERQRSSGYPLYGMGRSPDRSRLALYFDGAHCVQGYTSAADQFGPCRAIQWISDLQHNRIGRISSDRTGSKYLIVNGAYDSDFGLTRLLSSQSGPTVMAPDGEHAFVSLPQGVAKVRVSDGRYIERYPLPFGRNTWNRLLISPDGRTLVAVTRAIDGFQEQTIVRTFALP